MSMSYCRFENTLSDLRDCQDNIDEKPKSESERKARLRLIEICVEIAQSNGKEVR
jgi:hypothetical protein